MTSITASPFTTRVVEHRPVSSTAYELTLDRCGLAYVPGMLLTVHGSDPTHDREYSICSAPQQPNLQILYRYIASGRLTTYLRTLHAGDKLLVSGAHGTFCVRDPSAPIVFIATGTGIAPCLSYLRAMPDLRLTVVHGVREEDDLFYADELRRYRYLPCVSRTANASIRRRVTDAVAGLELDPENHYYLCGAYEMIHDVAALLAERGVNRSVIFQEPYYYGAGQ